MLIIISSGKPVATTQFPGDRFSCDIGTCTFSWSLKSSFFSFQTITHTVQKTGYTLSDILRIFRVYASRIPLAEWTSSALCIFRVSSTASRALRRIHKTMSPYTTLWHFAPYTVLGTHSDSVHGILVGFLIKNIHVQQSIFNVQTLQLSRKDSTAGSSTRCTSCSAIHCNATTGELRVVLASASNRFPSEQL